MANTFLAAGVSTSGPEVERIDGIVQLAGVDENGVPRLLQVDDEGHPLVDPSTITGLDASAITTGIFASGQIPSLAASKVTSGVFDPARLGSGTKNAYTYLDGTGNFSKPLSGFIVDPTSPPYNAVGDGVTDDRAAFVAAMAVVTALKGTLLCPPGKTFYFSKYLGIIDSPDVRIIAYGSSFIHAAPTTSSVTTDANAVLAGHVLSCFFVLRSDRARIEGGYYTTIGDNVDVVNANSGAGVYIRQSSDCFVGWIHYRGKSSMIGMDESDTLTTGNIIAFCSSYGARRPCSTADDTTYLGCRFEQPTTSDYDRVGNNGSSHAIYTFAGRSNVKVIGCHFEHIREYGVKFSGSSLAINNCIVANCTFVDNYRSGVMFGADDVQDHTAIIIEGNTFYNCLIGTADAVVEIMGSRSVIIRGNTFYWDIQPSTATGRYGIQVQRYTSTSQPVDSCLIEGNIFECRIESGYVTTPAGILSSAITCLNVGNGRTDFTFGIHYGGGLVIRGNYIAVGAGAVQCTTCIMPVMENNVISNIATGFNGGGNRIPIIRHNSYILGAYSGGNARIRLNMDSWPIIYENTTSGRTRNTTGNAVGNKSWTTSDANGGSTIVDFPLLGVRGKVATTDGKGEIVFAYGSGWTDGDTVILQGTTYTYATSITNAATQFNSLATLINLLDTQSFFDAADYGAPWSVVTGHIRVRQTTTNSSFTMTITTARRTAGVALLNGTGANTSLAFSVGGQATASRVHMWSPMIQMNSWIGLTPIESGAAALMAANGYYEVSAIRTADNEGAVSAMEVGTTAGTEQWRWALR